jgi:hypothetical protein
MANVTLRIRARCPNQTLVTVTFLPSGQEHYQIEKPPEKNAWDFAGRTFKSLAECTRVVHRRTSPISRREDVLPLWETVDDDPPQLLSSLRSKFSPKFTRLGPQIRTTNMSEDEKRNVSVGESKRMLKTTTRKTVQKPTTEVTTEIKTKPQPKKRTATAASRGIIKRAVRAPRIPHQVNPAKNDDSEPPEVIDPENKDSPLLTTLPTKEWTENALHRFFNRPERSVATDPVLLGFGPRAKRYGLGACFKFKGDFVHPKTQQVIRQWVRYTDLVPNPTYMAKLAAIHFNMTQARYKFLDTNDVDEWSDGVDEFIDDQGMALPDLSLDRSNPSATKKDKKTSKFPEFPISQFGNNSEGWNNAEDTEPERIGNAADYYDMFEKKE